MKPKILVLSILLSFLYSVSIVSAALTVSVDVSKSLTENEQATVTVTVANTAGSSTETNIVTELSSSPSWFSVVTACSSISSLSAGASQTSTCIIKPTSTGSDLSTTASSTSQGGTSGSGSTSGINVASQSSSLSASITADSSVSTSATFYVGVTVTAPSANNVANARATISESGQCTVDTSYQAATQSLGNITKGTSKSPTNWKLSASSASGTCTVTVNVVSDVGGSASPSKSITVTGGSSGSSSSSSSSSGGSGGGGGGTSAAKVVIGEKNAVITIPSIAAKSESSFSVDSPVLSITKMNIKVINTVANVQVTATKLDSRPSDVVSDAPGIANQYIRIDRVNISSADIEKVTFDFKVAKNWMTTNNINESTVTLHRYVNDNWNKLETVKVNETDTDFNYNATSPGLSVFAVAGELKIGASLPAPSTPAEESTAKEIQPEEIFKTVAGNPVTIILIIVGIAAVGGLIYFIRKK
ncbi:MAG: PGF-pre-PGF domain-containing protein [Candidatus Aenigmarchaeota archaeon]|nr:PGF-pre-PGF domain-containing protein [Candidatus Aenigmarchaeota archaeon]